MRKERENMREVEKLTERHGYTNGYIELSDIELAGLPETVEVNGETLLRKSEFHISLICAKRVAAIIDEANKNQIQNEIVESFKTFVSEVHPLDGFELTGELRLVTLDERKTIVVS